MIPYNAIGTDDAESIMPWTNICLIVVNFLVFFYELAVGAAGGDNALASFIQNYGLVRTRSRSRLLSTPAYLALAPAAQSPVCWAATWCCIRQAA